MALQFEKPDDDEELNDAGGSDEIRDEQGESVQGDDQQEDVDQTEELDEQEEGEQVDASTQPRPGRANRRIQALSEEVRTEREKRTQTEQQLQEMTQRLARLEQPRQEQPREPSEEEKALWSPQQLVDYEVKRALAPVSQSMQAIQRQSYETGDRANFNAVCASDQRAAKMKDEVEQFVAQQARQGNVIPREVAYTFLLGQKLRQGGSKARETQRREGQRRIERQRALGGSPRSDQSGDRRQLSEKEARDKRLENATF